MGSKSTDMVPTRVPIIGTEDHVAMVLRTTHQRGRLVTEPASIHPMAVRGNRWRVDVEILMPREHVRFTERHPIVATLGKALGFAALVFCLLASALAALLLILRHALADVDPKPLLGAAAVLILALLLAGNRINHSGACPGIAVHCRGCKH